MIETPKIIERTEKGKEVKIWEERTKHHTGKQV